MLHIFPSFWISWEGCQDGSTTLWASQRLLRNIWVTSHPCLIQSMVFGHKPQYFFHNLNELLDKMLTCWWHYCRWKVKGSPKLLELNLGNMNISTQFYDNPSSSCCNVSVTVMNITIYRVMPPAWPKIQRPSGWYTASPCERVEFLYRNAHEGNIWLWSPSAHVAE